MSNYADTSAASASVHTYTVRPVIGGVEPAVRIPIRSLAGHVVHFVWVGDLDGDGEYDYVLDRLPTTAGVTQKLEAYTRAGTLLWVRMTSVGNWARLVDFGIGGTNYLFITPRHSSSSGTLRFAIRTPSTAEQVINGTSALPVGVWSHVAVTLSGSTGTLYLNGVAVGQNTAMTLNPVSLGVTTQNYFGRSQFSADPYLNGAIDEVLIHGRALTAAEIAGLASPPAAPSGVNANAGVAQITLGWTSRYAVHRATIVGGPYATIATNAPGPSFLDAGLTPGTPYYYFLTAHKDLAEGPRSAVVSATPRSLLQDWRLTHFGIIDPTEPGAADLADPDGDGLANLLEYALGGAPLSAASAPRPVLDQADGFLRLVFSRIADPELVYSVEATDDLVSTWTPVWSSTGATNTPGPVPVSDPEPLATHPRRFLRLRITR